MVLRYWRILLVALALIGVGAYQTYGLFSNKGYTPQQPINFSHVIHAGVLQMECLYCHHNAEKGAHASIPSVELCMGCHSLVQTQSPEIQKLAEYYNSGQPVPWVRIHRLPDHAHFSHEWHVKAGVSCQECHGPIQSMPVVGQWQKLEMKDCMDCHRQDTYVDQIHHQPTFHEPGIHTEEGHGTGYESPAYVREGASLDAASAEQRESVSAYIEKYYGENVKNPEELASRLIEYQNNNYIHGRGAQLRNMNASVECSTCHY